MNTIPYQGRLIGRATGARLALLVCVAIGLAGCDEVKSPKPAVAAAKTASAPVTAKSVGANE